MKYAIFYTFLAGVNLSLGITARSNSVRLLSWLLTASLLWFALIELREAQSQVTL